MRDDVTSLLRKDGCPHSEGMWMELVAFASFLFSHYTEDKMCLSGKESNNDGLGHNKHIMKGANLAWLGT